MTEHEDLHAKLDAILALQQEDREQEQRDLAAIIALHANPVAEPAEPGE